jgi:histidine triad (HIT) family protein
MDCLFCKIVRGEIPSKKIYEDGSVLAFLDINPANPGHTLVVPKKHSEDITGVHENDLTKTIEAVRKITAKLKERMDAEGVNVIQNNGRAAGQLVSHVHFHVIPRFHGDNVVISYPKIQLSEEEMDSICRKLSEEKHIQPRRDLDLEF